MRVNTVLEAQAASKEDQIASLGVGTVPQNATLFDALVKGLTETREWARGERSLRVTVVEADEDDDPEPPGYHVVFQQGETGWTAMVPDLPGCVASGVEQWQAEEGIQEAIARRVAGLVSGGEDAPIARAWGKKVPVLPLSEFE